MKDKFNITLYILFLFSFYHAKVYIYKIDQLLALFIIFFNLYHIQFSHIIFFKNI